MMAFCIVFYESYLSTCQPNLSLLYFYVFDFSFICRKMGLKEGNSKCRHLKKRPVKGLYMCIRVYRILSHTRKGARGEQLNQRRDEVIHPSLKIFSCRHGAISNSQCCWSGIGSPSAGSAYFWAFRIHKSEVWIRESESAQNVTDPQHW